MSSTFEYYKHLGFKTPYCIESSTGIQAYGSFESAINAMQSPLLIDAASVISLLNKNYILGDRTIVQGINRAPWYAKINETGREWMFDTPPLHSMIQMSASTIAERLFEKLCAEIKLYIKDKKRVGVLLSGGMDSRMLAGVIDYLSKTNQLIDVEVTGLTWGNPNSRDVVYAKEIASRLGWEWKHYVVNAENLMENIYETARRGCEYSPVHLHALPQIVKNNNLDVVLAGSYGDSVGRAEYSGVKVRKIKPMLAGMTNPCNLLYTDVYAGSVNSIYNDVNAYHRRFQNNKGYIRNELDYQLHYMRRMLNPCMEVLSSRYDFHQMFTSPEVFGFMWSLDPSSRTDDVYKFLLDCFVTDLSDIPWARTGLPYGETQGRPDSYTKKHHSYVEIIREEMLENIIRMISSSKLLDLGVFSSKSLTKFLQLVKKYPTSNIYYYERVVWLASLGLMCDIYQIQSNYRGKIEPADTKIYYSYLKNYLKYAVQKYFLS